MRMRIAIAVCAVVALLSSVTPATAEPILISVGGQLQAALGVDVGGTLYDVGFRDGSCISLYSGCDSPSDFAFTTSASATAAGQALLDQVFVDLPGRNFDTAPSINGCVGVTGCVVFTPFSAVADVIAAFNFAGSNTDILIQTVVSPAFDFLIVSDGTYAVWTPRAASPVPEPTSLLLLGTGAAGLIARRRRPPKPAPMAALIAAGFV